MTISPDINYEKVNALFPKVIAGNEEATIHFFNETHRHLEKATQHIAKKHEVRDEGEIEDAALEAFRQSIRSARNGGIPTWQEFNQRFQQKLYAFFKKLNHCQDFSPLKAFSQCNPPIKAGSLRIEAPEEKSRMDMEELTHAVDKALGTLDTRDAEVLRLRYGLGETPEHTLDETGNIFGITRERARQIQARATRKLMHPDRSGPIEDFANNIDQIRAERTAQALRDLKDKCKTLFDLSVKYSGDAPIDEKILQTLLDPEITGGKAFEAALGDEVVGPLNKWVINKHEFPKVIERMRKLAGYQQPDIGR